MYNTNPPFGISLMIAAMMFNATKGRYRQNAGSELYVTDDFIHSVYHHQSNPGTDGHCHRSFGGNIDRVNAQIGKELAP